MNDVLSCALARSAEWLASLPSRPVRGRVDAATILADIDGEVPAAGVDPVHVIEELARVAEPGLTAMPSGRFFGWVIGGGLPAAVAADWLTTVWDQNAGTAEGTPAAAAFEQVALRWVIELLDLPRRTSGALVTGAQMANFVALAAARSHVLGEVGWDVEADGLIGAPAVEVLVGGERHDTVDKALRLLGLGARRARVIPADILGRMRADALRDALAACRGPTIVVAQVGNVNGGAVDPVADIVALVDEARRRLPIWLHVDGAFGLWARASASLRGLARGVERADSWATDAHKWLNTPYDCGIALCARPEVHRRAMTMRAAYLPGGGEPGVRSPVDYTPELSRRARGFALWAALRQLGRAGVEDLVDRCCALARLFAARLASIPGAELLGEVVLNQVVVRFAGDDERNRGIVDRVQREGTCYPTPTVWQGRAAMRISVSNWSTTEADVERSVQAIASVVRAP